MCVSKIAIASNTQEKKKNCLMCSPSTKRFTTSNNALNALDPIHFRILIQTTIFVVLRRWTSNQFSIPCYKIKHNSKSSTMIGVIIYAWFISQSAKSNSVVYARLPTSSKREQYANKIFFSIKSSNKCIISNNNNLKFAFKVVKKCMLTRKKYRS